MKPFVIKIGGSTLGSHDTTLEDVVALQKKKISVVVIHGGAREVTSWLTKLNITTSFINGLRITDLPTLKVVTAILGGLVNKELVASIWRFGGKAIGLCGADGNLIQAKNKTPELGYTGEELKVDSTLLWLLLNDGYIPVIAPICLGLYDSSQSETNLINVNGDTIAAEIAASLNAEKLIFLTDVPGIYDNTKKLIDRLNIDDARRLMESGVANGGMVAKIEACLMAVPRVSEARIIDGKIPHALLNEINGSGVGTTIG